jgi:hypothetical protein
MLMSWLVFYSKIAGAMKHIPIAWISQVPNDSLGAAAYSSVDHLVFKTIWLMVSRIMQWSFNCPLISRSWRGHAT